MKNKYIKCIHKLDTGDFIYNVNEVYKIVDSEQIEVDDFMATIYHVKNNGKITTLLDFEIKEFFQEIVS